MTPPRTPTHADIPASQCYWAVLTLPRGVGTATRRHRTESLRHVFQTALPLPIENVHVTLIPLSDGTHLACGIDRELLTTLVASQPDRLGPTAPPAGLCDDLAYPVPRINLLHGAFTPARTLARASRRRATLAACAFALCMLVSIGAERRRAAFLRYETAHAAALERRAREYGATASTLPPLMRLTSELRRLQASAAQVGPEAMPRNAAIDLASLLSRWPDDASPTADSIRVEGGVIALGLRDATPGGISDLLDRLAGDSTWAAEQPHIVRGRDTVQGKTTLRATGAPRQERQR